MATTAPSMRAMAPIEDGEFIDLDDPKDFMPVNPPPSFNNRPYWNTGVAPAPPQLPQVAPQLPPGHRFFDVGMAPPPHPAQALAIPMQHSMQVPQPHGISPPPTFAQGNILSMHPRASPMHSMHPSAPDIMRVHPPQLPMHNPQPPHFIRIPPPTPPLMHPPPQRPLHTPMMQPPRAPLIPRPTYESTSVQHMPPPSHSHRMPSRILRSRTPSPPPQPLSPSPSESPQLHPESPPPPPPPPPPRKKPSLAELRRRALAGMPRTNPSMSNSSILIPGSSASSIPSLPNQAPGDAIIFEFSTSDEESEDERIPSPSVGNVNSTATDRKRAIEDMKIRVVRLGQCPSMLTKDTNTRAFAERGDGIQSSGYPPLKRTPSLSLPAMPSLSAKASDNVSIASLTSGDNDALQSLQTLSILTGHQGKWQPPTPAAKRDKIALLRRQIKEMEQRIAQQKSDQQTGEHQARPKSLTSPLPNSSLSILKRSAESTKPHSGRHEPEKRRRYYSDIQRSSLPAHDAVPPVSPSVSPCRSAPDATESTSSSVSAAIPEPSLWKENSVRKLGSPVQVDTADTRLINDLRLELEESKKALDSERDANRLIQAADVSVAEAYAKLGFKRSRLRSVQHELKKAQTDIVTAEEEYRTTVAAAQRVRASLGEDPDNTYPSIDIPSMPAEQVSGTPDISAHNFSSDLDADNVKQPAGYQISPIKLTSNSKEGNGREEDEEKARYQSDLVLRPSPYTPSPTDVYTSVLTGLKAYGLRIPFSEALISSKPACHYLSSRYTSLRATGLRFDILSLQRADMSLRFRCFHFFDMNASGSVLDPNFHRPQTKTAHIRFILRIPNHAKASDRQNFSPLSLTWARKLDPNKALCPQELRGQCSNRKCIYQHLRLPLNPTLHAINVIDSLQQFIPTQTWLSAERKIVAAKLAIYEGKNQSVDDIVLNLISFLCPVSSKIPFAPLIQPKDEPI